MTVSRLVLLAVLAVVALSHSAGEAAAGATPPSTRVPDTHKMMRRGYGTVSAFLGSRLAAKADRVAAKASQAAQHMRGKPAASSPPKSPPATSPPKSPPATSPPKSPPATSPPKSPPAKPPAAAVNEVARLTDEVESLTGDHERIVAFNAREIEDAEQALRNAQKLANADVLRAESRLAKFDELLENPRIGRRGEDLKITFIPRQTLEDDVVKAREFALSNQPEIVATKNLEEVREASLVREQKVLAKLEKAKEALSKAQERASPRTAV